MVPTLPTPISSSLQTKGSSLFQKKNILCFSCCNGESSLAGTGESPGPLVITGLGEGGPEEPCEAPSHGCSVLNTRNGSEAAGSSRQRGAFTLQPYLGHDSDSLAATGGNEPAEMDKDMSPRGEQQERHWNLVPQNVPMADSTRNNKLLEFQCLI